MQSPHKWVTGLRVRFKRGSVPDSYQRLFSGRGDQHDADVVIADLIKATGFMDERQAPDSDGALISVGAHNVIRLIFKNSRIQPEKIQTLAQMEPVNE